MFLKNASFHGVHLDFLVSEDTTGHHMKRLSECFNKGISGGVVKPLNTTVFDRHYVEDAFRFMTKRKHIGKVLIKVINRIKIYVSKMCVL
jgi:NADPH:quinone reductase-like Zn-dependent oxidoreductase